jgi:hypothetical protein
MKRWFAMLAGLVGLITIGGTVIATPAQAAAPAHGTATFDFSTPDFLGSAPTGDPGSPPVRLPRDRHVDPSDRLDRLVLSRH